MRMHMNFNFKTKWIVLICLAVVVISNINLGIEVRDASKDLSKKLDELENNMVALNSGTDDMLLPEISPEEFSGEVGSLFQGEEMNQKTFAASLTSQTERVVIASVARISNNMLEIGTGHGGTTLVMARYSEPKSIVHTIDLPHDIKSISYEQGDSPTLVATSLNSRTSGNYAYEKDKCANKINQIYSDTKNFDESKLSQQLDFIFIDGAKTYSYIKNDTEKALRMIKPGGVVIWHHYDKAHPDVVRFLNELSKDYKLQRVKGTALTMYRAVDI
jgi:hypothetical protein